MRQKRNSKYKNLYTDDCEVLNIYRNKAIIKVSESENLIARRVGKIKSGDKVSIYKMQTLGKSEEIFIYVSPLYYLFLGFVFGFLFKSDLFHYLLSLGLSALGFAQLFVIRHIYKKLPEAYYVSVKKAV